MASILVFVIAFVAGCFTGVIVWLWLPARHHDDLTREPVFHALPADD